MDIASSLSIEGELTGISTFESLNVLKVAIINNRATPITFGFNTFVALGDTITVSFCSFTFIFGGSGTNPSFNEAGSISDHFWFFILKYRITKSGINPPITVMNLSNMYPEEYQIGNENNTTSYT